MNFTESFDQFSSNLSGMDIALYAGVGLALWVMFKDKLSPIQKLLSDVLGKVKLPTVVKTDPVVVQKEQDDIFFQLVSSWKQTRDLAVKSGCAQAVKVADDMFPFLSPTGCKDVTVTKKDTVV